MREIPTTTCFYLIMLVFFYSLSWRRSAKGEQSRFFIIVLTAGGLLTLLKSTEITEQKKIGKPVYQPAIMTETNTNTMSLTQIIYMVVK